MLNCPRCGAQNQGESTYCVRCGADLKAAPKADRGTAPPRPSGSMRASSDIMRRRTGNKLSAGRLTSGRRTDSNVKLAVAAGQQAKKPLAAPPSPGGGPPGKKPKRQSTMLWRPGEVEAAAMAAAAKEGVQDGSSEPVEPLTAPALSPGAEGSAGASSAAVSSSSPDPEPSESTEASTGSDANATVVLGSAGMAEATGPEASASEQVVQSDQASAAVANEAATSNASDSAGTNADASTAPASSPESDEAAPIATVSASTPSFDDGAKPVDSAPGEAAKPAEKKAPAKTMIGLPGFGSDLAGESPWGGGAPGAAEADAPKAEEAQAAEKPAEKAESAGDDDAGIVIGSASPDASKAGTDDNDDAGIVIETGANRADMATPPAQKAVIPAAQAAPTPAKEPEVVDDESSYVEASRRGFTHEGRPEGGGNNTMMIAIAIAIVVIVILIFAFK